MANSSCKRGLKRDRAPERTGNSQDLGNIRQTKCKRSWSPSPSFSGLSSEGHSGSENLEESVYNLQSSAYDDLLSVLQPCSQHSEGRQKREQGAGGDKKEEGSNAGSSGLEEGDETEELRSHSLRGEMVGSKEGNNVDDDSCNEDNDSDIDNNGQISAEATASTSSFAFHVGHILAETEVQNLTRRNWKFKWVMPGIENMSLGKWVGTSEPLLKDVDCCSGYGLKPKLYKHWMEIHNVSSANDFHSSRQKQFFSLCNSYSDIMHCNKKPFYLKGIKEDSSIMDAYIMHVLNHVFRTRDHVTKNDAKLAKHPNDGREDVLNSDLFLDQGFTRPKVLILLPLRSIALRVVKRLIQLTPPSHKVSVEYVDRFMSEFGIEEDEEANDENLKARKTTKPADYEALFGGNNDDHFMLGIKFTRRSVKLFSDFYSSDVIVASPFALITKMGEAKVEKEKDVDYLSSIEVLIIDHADVISMQNWSHVDMVVEQLNRMPSKPHRTDVMRIRKWYLDGHARHYRQTILLGYFPNPEINALFHRHCMNYKGKVKLICEHKGVIPKIILKVRQIYERFDAALTTDVDDARFKFFTEKVFPNMKDSVQGGLMLFISSYFEFVRLRNFLKSQNASFCSIMDHTKPSDISRARGFFFHGQRKIMLYTERAHFYHRYKIRGVKNLIIYSLPERKEFYPEILNMFEESTNMSCTVLFTGFDKLRLERIVGTPSANRMLSSDKKMFLFC